MPSDLPSHAVVQNPFFTYRARPIEVIDGDTVDLRIDLGFRLSHHIRVRLVGVDTHEIYGVEDNSEEYKLGKEEQSWVTQWFDSAEKGHDGDWPLLASTLYDRTGKYGRYLADIYRRDTGESLTDSLLSEFSGVAD